MTENDHDPIDDQISDALHEVAERHEPSPGAARASVASGVARRSAQRRAVTIGVPVVLLLVGAVALSTMGSRDNRAELATESRGVENTSTTVSDEGSTQSSAAPAPSDPDTDENQKPPSDDQTREAPGPGSVPEDQGPIEETPTPQDQGTPGTQFESGPPSTATGPPTTTPGPAQPTVQDGQVVITEAHDGMTVEVSRGDRVEIRLSGSSGLFWSEPVSSNGAAVSRQSATTSPDGAASGSFVAADAGNASIMSDGTPECAMSDPPCGAPNRMFTVTIVVR